MSGGIGVLVGGLLQTAGTQIAVGGSPSSGLPISWVGVTILGVALIALAMGRSGRDGIVGSSRLGRTALVGASVAWILTVVLVILAQFVGQSLFGAYFGISIVAVLGFLLAAIVIQRSKVAVGAEGALNLVVGIVYLAGARRQGLLSAESPPPPDH